MESLLPHQIGVLRKIEDKTIQNEEHPDHVSLRHLKNLGLVEYQSTDDNGIIYCSVTGAGQAILAELNKPWYKRYAKYAFGIVTAFIKGAF